MAVCCIKLFRCLSFHVVSVPEVPDADAKSPSAGVVYMSVIQTRFCGRRMAFIASGEGNDADRAVNVFARKKSPLFLSEGAFSRTIVCSISGRFLLALPHSEAGAIDYYHL